MRSPSAANVESDFIEDAGRFDLQLMHMLSQSLLHPRNVALVVPHESPDMPELLIDHALAIRDVIHVLLDVLSYAEAGQHGTKSSPDVEDSPSLPTALPPM